MKFEQNFSVSENIDVIRDHINLYLNNAGYKKVSTKPELVYQRGSVFGSWMSFSPKGWLARVNIKLLETSVDEINVVLNVDVNTTGQLVTEKERSFWNLELKNLQEAIESGSGNVMEVSGSEKESMKENLAMGALIIILMVVFIIIANIYLETRLASFLGAFVGGFLGFLIAKKVLKF